MIVTSSLFAVGLPQHSSLQHFTLRIVSGSSVNLSVDVASGVSYGGDNNSYTEYAGQGVIFTLTMEDGTQTEIMAYNPFLVIDGVGYKTKYEPC